MTVDVWIIGILTGLPRFQSLGGGGKSGGGGGAVRQHGSNLDSSSGTYITGSVPLCTPAVSQPGQHVSPL